MCTFSISVDDTLMDSVRSSFADNEAIRNWMQSQIVLLLQQMSTDMTQPQKQKLSSRLRGIAAHAPKGFDYKEELYKRF